RAVARTPRPQPAVRPAAVARNSATSAPRDLSDLLPGWSVLGA
ncbi:MAG: hypothetical protein JWN77_1909, partial [Frankiales bacterium]|nr:hypothetical protein [Frankiales bacterium]